MAETTTLGVRFYEAERQTLPRKTERWETPWGTVGLKRFTRPGPLQRFAPEFTIEYEDLKSLAAREHKSLGEMETLLRSHLIRHKSACTA
jgi:uncharacterized protein (DUF111 family)